MSAGYRIIDSIVIRPCYLGTIGTALLGTIQTGNVGTQLHMSCMQIVVYTICTVHLCAAPHIFPLIDIVMGYRI